MRDLDGARRRLAAMALFPLWLVGVALVVAGGMPWLAESRDGSVLNAPFGPDGLWWTIPMIWLGVNIAWLVGSIILDLIDR